MRCSAAPTLFSGFDLSLVYEANLLTGASNFRRAFGKPTPLEEDVLHLGAAIYATDLAARRSERESFVRNIELTVHVTHLHLFDGLKGELENLLYRLSNDNWTITFAPTNMAHEKPRQWPSKDGLVILFSGGLDSFTAAIGSLQNGLVPNLVSHITGNQVIAGAQTRLQQYLAQTFKTNLPHFTFRVSGRTVKTASFPRDKEREDTQRTRSFLFLALACLVGRRTGSNRVIVMAENGFFTVS